MEFYTDIDYCTLEYHMEQNRHNILLKARNNLLAEIHGSVEAHFDYLFLIQQGYAYCFFGLYNQVYQ
jgi:hypothetical protein